MPFFLFEHKNNDFIITIGFLGLAVSNLKWRKIDKNISSIDLLQSLDRKERWFYFPWLALGAFYSQTYLRCMAQDVTLISVLSSVNSVFMSLPELPI